MKCVAREVNDHFFNGSAEDPLGRESIQSPMKFRGESDVDAMVVQLCVPSSVVA